MTWLRRRCRDLAADGNALARRQHGPLLDLCDQQIKSLLRVRLNQLQPWKCGHEGFDVIAVLYFIEPIFRCAFFRRTDRRVVVAMQRRLAVVNIADLAPHPLTVTLFASHPPTTARIAQARAWARTHGLPDPPRLAAAEGRP